MKIWQALEQIFLFRISSKEEIDKYIQKISRMGKFDEPKKVKVFSLILERLAEAEARIEVLETKKPALSTDASTTVEAKIDPKRQAMLDRLAKAREAKKNKKK